MLYAAVNTLIDRKLAKVSPIANTAYIYVVLTMMTVPLVIFRERLGIQLTMPESSQAWMLIGCAAIFFAADLAWFQAYHTKGSRLKTIAATFLAFPLLTALFKGMSSGIYPTRTLGVRL